MEEVSLTETETRYYGDLFLCCDEEKSGKIPMLKASELFRSADLSNERIQEIISLAGIPDTALHVSRVQFYSCLKLIAAHQAAMPLRQELVAASVQLPLPRFSWTDSTSKTDTVSHQHHHAIPPPPITDRRNSLQRRTDWSENNTTSSRRNSTGPHQHQPEKCVVNSDLPSTDSEVEQCESSCGAEGVAGNTIHTKHHRRVGSPEAWSTNSDSPTPTNSVAERPWAKDTLWHGLLGDEHRQLLGTEEESSDRHSSDDDNDTDLETVYEITPEQREYYLQQFKAVQHDTNGLLSGQAARVFFEKSRIPVEELRHIWQLCDVSRDCALSLAEFTAAMHLVVLRRNNIPLPSTLPVCLHPSVLENTTLANQISTQEPPEADLLHLDDEDDEDNTDNTIKCANSGTNIGAVAGKSTRCINEKSVMNMSTLSSSSKASANSSHCPNATVHNNPHTLTPPTIPPPPFQKNRSISNSPKAISSSSPGPTSNMSSTKAGYNTKDCTLWTTSDAQPSQWTKFNESPTSNVSSPGPKPVNFDMQRTAQAVVSDPQILHPVPLRVTPIGGVTATASSLVAAVPQSNEKQEGIDCTTSIRETSPKSLSFAANSATQQNNDLRAIQRPQAKKIPPKNIGAIPPPPQREQTTVVSNALNITAENETLNVSICGGGLSTSMMVNRKDPPPLPPPRPHRHGRSSSLDLNKFKISSQSCVQPEIMTQASFDLQTSAGFADFTQFSDDNHITSVIIDPQHMHSLPAQNIPGRGVSQTTVKMPPTRLSLQSNQRVSAFEVYRKPCTPRNSQSPQPVAQVAVAPFGSVGATALTAMPSLEIYEKRVNSISETLRHVSFRQDSSNSNNSMSDVLRHLREQNNLLLRLCNDLSHELLTVQTRKEEMRLLLESSSASNSNEVVVASVNAATVQNSGVARTSSSISAPVTANITGGSGSSGVHSNA